MPTKAIRLIGELLILAGVVMGLWLVYENYFTNAMAFQASKTAEAKLTDQWKRDALEALKPLSHQPFALVYVPRLRQSVWGLPVIEGVDQSDLAQGLGHYPLTDLPGQSGNFAIAGHRVTHGQPFFDFPKLEAGDLIYVKTSQAWYSYKLFATKFVSPSAYAVVTRSPGVSIPMQARGESLITLTTCDPAWNSYRRWVWWGSLTGTYSSANPPIQVGG